MPVRISCPHCHKDLRLPEDLFAGPAQCPLCSGAFGVRWGVQPRRSEDRKPTLPSAPQRRPCRYCGGMIRPEAVKCRYCGEWLDED
jgi:hypothetical protein